jgi:peptide/nickel transport system substrate-binding protein
MALTRRGFAAAAAIGAVLPRAVRAAEGVLNVATIGEPPTLDPMVSTADLVGTVCQHFHETLYTFGKEWAVVPLLAAGMPEVSGSGTVYTIPIRSDVVFHDGTRMGVEDVMASLRRWLSGSVRGKQTSGNVAALEAGAGFVRITLKQPYAPLLSLLAFNNSAAVVMPAGAQGGRVGTGPYRIKEHKPDQYLQLVRHEAYLASPAAPRRAVVGEIRFVPVPDPDTRVAGALTGQFDYVDNLSVEAFARIDASKVARPVVLKPYGWPVLAMNTKQGTLADVALRRAVQVALSPEDMMAAAFGVGQFASAEGAMYPAGFPWHSDKGVVRYGEADPVKAAAMAKAAAYAGGKIRLMATRQYEFHYKIAQVAVEYLKQAGFNVELQISDWATLTQRRTDPALWEIYVTSSPFLPEPALNGYMLEDSPGWWATPRKRAAVAAFNGEVDPVKRVALFAEIQAAIFDEAPIFKVGNYNALSARSAKLEGFTPAPWPYFWNTSLAA